MKSRWFPRLYRRHEVRTRHETSDSMAKLQAQFNATQVELSEALIRCDQLSGYLDAYRALYEHCEKCRYNLLDDLKELVSECNGAKTKERA